jgi:hypothetical protein
LGSCLFALSGEASNAIQGLTSGISVLGSAGSTLYTPLYLSHLAWARAELDQFGEAWRRFGEAMTVVETTKERWYEADIRRIAVRSR